MMLAPSGASRRPLGAVLARAGDRGCLCVGVDCSSARRTARTTLAPLAPSMGRLGGETGRGSLMALVRTAEAQGVSPRILSAVLVVQESRRR